MTSLTLPAPPLPRIIEGQCFRAPLRDQHFADALYRDCHFDHIVWSGCRLSNLRFVNCRFDANRFEHCELQKIAYDGTRIHTGTWTDCVLRDLSFNTCEVQDVCWKDSVLRDTICTKAKGTSWTFDAVRGAHVSFVAGELAGVHLRGGHWTDSAWIGSQLNEVRAESVELANFIVGQSHCTAFALLECRGINVRWIDSTIERMTIRASELKQAAWSHSHWALGDIRVSTLPLASCDHATLSGLTIADSDLTQAAFDHASVTDSDWHRLQAPRIALRDARLTRVRLTAAQLPGIDARGAQLNDVRVTGSNCRSGHLNGQPRPLWSAADTRGATFDEAAAHDEQLWRQRTQPGARGL